MSSLIIANYFNKNTNLQSEELSKNNLKNIFLNNKSNNYNNKAHNPISSNFAKTALDKIGEKDESFAIYSFISSNTTNKIQLINKVNPLDEKYEPENLISINSFLDESIVLKEMDISSELKKPLIDMFKASKKADFPYLSIISAYRSFEKQSTLFDIKLESQKKLYDDDETTYEKASQVVAIPGTSEHQSGFAIDLTTKSVNFALVEDFVNTDEGKWVDENCWKYGFIVRYPPSKINITEIIYEPWHLRYTGLPHSEIMYNENYCLEEYLEYLKKETTINFKSYNKENYQIIYFDSNASENYDLDITANNITDITQITNEEYVITLKLN
jgi:D-alanyl-D-alanine carboxypeptidase